MSRVTTTITIAADPEAVFEVALDPWRLGDWVTIHREIHKAPKRPLEVGDVVEQTMALRGAPFKVKWRVTELTPGRSATWEGTGPAGSKATTEYRLKACKGGTEFSYMNEFAPPGGLVGRVAAGALVGDLPSKEANASLERLKQLIEADQ